MAESSAPRVRVVIKETCRRKANRFGFPREVKIDVVEERRKTKFGSRGVDVFVVRLVRYEPREAEGMQTERVLSRDK